jgi:hypothetical protein
MGIRLLSRICTTILIEAVLSVQDSFHIAVPIIKLYEIPQEDETTMTVVGRDTLNLVCEEYFVKIGDLVLQLAFYFRKVISIARRMLKKATRQAPVPVHPFDDMDNAVAISLSFLDRIDEHL